jgi:hypothetical protein
MNKFMKEHFMWDGSYLTYSGPGARMMMDVCPDAHPSWEGKRKPEFVARFKYGPYKPWKAWVNFLIKADITVEGYRDLLAHGDTPVGIIKMLGYKGKI